MPSVTKTQAVVRSAVFPPKILTSLSPRRRAVFYPPFDASPCVLPRSHPHRPQLRRRGLKAGEMAVKKP